jgi:flavorubredoxin
VNVPFKSRVVKNDDTLDLGNKTLRFINAPNLHWPDTMFSYLEEDQLLFTCDSFGAHYCDEKMIDSEVDPEKHADSFQYYFDVILKPFSKFMLQAVEKIRPLDIKAVLPGHGPMLLHDWKKWVDKSEVDAKNYLSFPKKHHVFIPYVSAYQYTGKIAEKIAEGIRSVDDVEVEVVDIEHMPVGEMEGRLTRADAFMVGSTTINQNILLPVYKLLAVVNPIRDKGKPVGMFGSYGWSGEARKILAAALQVLKLKPFGDGVFVKLKPSVEDETLAFNYGKDFALDLVKK